MALRNVGRQEYGLYSVAVGCYGNDPGFLYLWVFSVARSGFFLHSKCFVPRILRRRLRVV